MTHLEFFWLLGQNSFSKKCFFQKHFFLIFLLIFSLFFVAHKIIGDIANE